GGRRVKPAGRVYAAGYFGTVGGQPRHGVAAITPAGAISSWDANGNGSVLVVATDGAGHVFAGGQFDSVNMQARDNLAAINAANGTPTSWNPGATQGGSQTNAQVWALQAAG